jgi:hypothetical protein
LPITVPARPERQTGVTPTDWLMSELGRDFD